MKVIGLALPALFAFSLGCTPPSIAKGQGNPSPTGSDAKVRTPAALFDLLSATREEAESLLGRPDSTEKFSTPVGGKMVKGERCRYGGVKAAKVVRIEWQKRSEAFQPMVVKVSFDKGVDWKKAATLVGLKPSGLKYKSFYPGFGELKGHPLKGWNVMCSGYKAVAPSSGVLTNEEEGGLPQIVFESPSLFGG